MSKLEWVKEHKKELLIGTGATVAIGVLGYLGIKNWKSDNAIQIMSLTPSSDSFVVFDNIKDINVTLDTATVTEAWNETFGNGIALPQLILNDFKASDIGKLGEELIEKVPGVTDETILTCILGATSSVNVSNE